MGREPRSPPPRGRGEGAPHEGAGIDQERGEILFFLKKKYYSWIFETVVVNLHRAEDTTTPPKIGEKEKEKGGAGEEKEEGE